MKKRIGITLACIAALLIAYAILGWYGIHEEECIKCGTWRTQLRIGSVPLLSRTRETDVSSWYRSYDTNHSTHSWGSVCGSEHKWFRGRPGWGSYDNFGWTTAYALRSLHKRQAEMPAEELNRIMKTFVVAEVASITGGVWCLPKDREEESQKVESAVPSTAAPSASADVR